MLGQLFYTSDTKMKLGNKSSMNNHKSKPARFKKYRADKAKSKGKGKGKGK